MPTGVNEGSTHRFLIAGTTSLLWRAIILRCHVRLPPCANLRMSQCSPVRALSGRIRAHRTREQTATERGPWDRADTEHLHKYVSDGNSCVVSCDRRRTCLQRREHLTLFLAIDHAVMVLHRNERRKVVGDSIVCDVVSTTISEYGAPAYILCI